MQVFLETLLGTPFVGLYLVATEKYCLIPLSCYTKNIDERIGSVLGVATARAKVCDSPFLGLFMRANSNGMVLPNLAGETVEDWLKTGVTDFHVESVEDKYTALGNLILANDKGAVISGGFSGESEKKIRDALGVEVARGTVAGLNTVGSCAVATNNGVLAHPEITEDEIKLIEGVLKVKVGIGTLNRGSPFVGACVAANSSGAVVGSLSTPVEVTNLEDTL